MHCLLRLLLLPKHKDSAITLPGEKRLCWACSTVTIYFLSGSFATYLRSVNCPPWAWLASHALTVGTSIRTMLHGMVHSRQAAALVGIKLGWIEFKGTCSGASGLRGTAFAPLGPLY